MNMEKVGPDKKPFEEPEVTDIFMEPEELAPVAEVEEDRPRKRGCLGTSFIWVGILLILLILAGFVGVLEGMSLLLPASNVPKEIEVDIPQGASADKISEILENAGVIKSAKAFRYLVKFRKAGPRLKAGEQVLDANLSADEIIKALVQGRFKMYPVTIPEGLTMKEIASLMAAKGKADANEFLALCHDKEFIKTLDIGNEDSLEGYLFPETYNFRKTVTAREIIKAMVARFHQVWKKYAIKAQVNPLSRHQIITLASIVEKETGAAEERPMIAKVFLNRLEKGMRLETDPTVIYGIQNFNGNLTRKDLKTEHPYNTYVIAGLPPGPIANPGEASIRAVLEPANVDYLYFVSKNDGTHHFSKTLKEHNRAVNKYQRGQ